MKHSPAPWRWIPQIDDSEDMPILVDANNEKVCDFGNCTTYYPIEGTPPNDENSKLIEAAPELLEALKAMLSRFEDTDTGMVKAEYVKDMARKAIAKATT